MAMDTLRHQCAFVAAKSDTNECAAFNQAFAGAAAVVRGELGVPEGVLSAAELALAYALLRHRLWVHAPVLEDVLVDMITRDFGLARDASHWLVQAPIAALRFLDGGGDGGDGRALPSDRDFLRYIFVACATAPDEGALVRDLGLGQALLKRVRGALASLVVPGTEGGMSANGADAALVYLPEVDAEIVQVAADLAREQEALPWALEVHRLRYDLLSIAAPWATVIEENGARWVFDVLLNIGSRGDATEAQLERRLKQQLGTKLPTAAGAVATLLTALEALELIYPCPTSSKRQAAEAASDPNANRRWRLTPTAQDLTAAAFACHRINALATPQAVIEALRGQNPAYQAALVRGAESLEPEHLEQIIRGVRPLSPAGLKEALTRLGARKNAEAARQEISGIIATESSPWLRKAACEALALMSSTKEAAQILARILKSDPSPAVRAAARQTALRAAARPAFPALEAAMNPAEAS